MANEKRQRQDRNRTLKQQEVVKAAAKSRRREKLTRIGAIAGVAVLAVALLAVFTRGGDDDTSTTAAADTVPAATTLPPLKPSGPAPTITIPAGDPPKELQIKDLVVGTGPVIENGDLVEAFYTGTSWLTKQQFDENFTSASPFPVTVGAGGVILGWDEGLVGMREGGRRQLIIPPDKAYGSTSPSDKIAKDDTLVFVIEAARVTKTQAATTTTAASAAGTATTAAPTTTAPTTAAPTTAAPTTAAPTTTAATTTAP